MAEPLSRDERDRHLMHWPSTCGRWEATVQQVEARAEAERAARERLREELDDAREALCDVWQDLALGPTAREWCMKQIDKIDAALRADDEARGRA